MTATLTNNCCILGVSQLAKHECYKRYSTGNKTTVPTRKNVHTDLLLRIARCTSWRTTHKSDVILYHSKTTDYNNTEVISHIAKWTSFCCRFKAPDSGTNDVVVNKKLHSQFRWVKQTDSRWRSLTVASPYRHNSGHRGQHLRLQSAIVDRLPVHGHDSRRRVRIRFQPERNSSSRRCVRCVRDLDAVFKGSQELYHRCVNSQKKQTLLTDKSKLNFNLVIKCTVSVWASFVLGTNRCNYHTDFTLIDCLHGDHLPVSQDYPEITESLQFVWYFLMSPGGATSASKSLGMANWQSHSNTCISCRITIAMTISWCYSLQLTNNNSRRDVWRTKPGE